MSINGLGLNAYQGIDVQNVNKVTKDIFASLENKTVDLNKVDLTQFKRQTLGVDLYNQRQSLDVQRQVAMTNAGLLNTTGELSAVQILNAQAAAQLYNPNTTVKNVEGKLHVNATGNVETLKEVFAPESNINVFETQKDKKGSNPFTFTGSSNDENKKQEKEPLNLVA